MTMKELTQKLEERYPLEKAESWDNSGLQVGRKNKAVRKVFLALDATDAEIKEAREAVEKVEAKKNEAIEKLEEENRKNSIGIYLRFVKQGAISLSEAAKELGIPKSDLELMI